MRILIALDGSECSQAALDSVIIRTWPDHSEFLLLSVAEPLLADLGGMVPDDEKRFHKKLIDIQVKTLKLKFPQHKVEGKVVEGSACNEIVKTAAQWNADFIIMGSYGRGSFDHFVLGSVAESVVNKSMCSVEVIKFPQNKVALGSS